MKKSTFFIVLAVIAVMLIAWVGCTTKATVDAGPTVTDIAAKWEGSGHADAAAEAFVHWNEDEPAEIPPTCAKCHSTDGARDYFGADGTEAGKVDAPAQINDPISCTACHSTAVAAMTSVTLPSGAVLNDTGADTACSTCHSGMGSSTQVKTKVEGLPEDEVIADSTMMGAHYFAAAATHAGSEGYSGFQYDGKTYVGTFEHAESVNSCTECHDPHSTHLQDPPEGQATICAACHADVKGYADYKTVSMSKVDFDGNGKVEPIYNEIEGMKAILIKALGGYSGKVAGKTFGFNPAAYPYSFIDTNADGTLSEEESAFPNQFKGFTPRMLKAAYNLMFVTKDPGAYVHNPKYALQLMYDSIEDLSAQSGVTTAGLIRP
ncbi:MAG: hypothetical protein WBI14_01960 [Anaerolineaceae bacterium]